MTVEAWSFLGASVTAFCGIIVAIVAEHGQTRRALLSVRLVAQEAADSAKPVANGAIPAIQMALSDIRKVQQAHSELHSSTQTRLDGLSSRVDGLSGRVDDLADHFSQRLDGMHAHLDGICARCAD